MINIREILAANLKENRRKKGLTQEKLAEQANMSLQYLAMLELARKFPSGEMLERLAQALDIEPHQLFSVSADPEDALEHLHRAIVLDIRKIMIDMERVVGEAVERALSVKCKN